MNHVEIQSGAIATFKGEPTPEAIEALRNVAEHFASPIETFLSVNSIDIQPAVRARVRECLVKGEVKAAIDLVPDFLQDAFRRMLNEAEYQRRVKGQVFKSDKKEVWI